MDLSARSFLPDRHNALHAAQLKARQGADRLHDLTLSNPTRVGLNYEGYRVAQTSGESIGLLGRWQQESTTGGQYPDYSVEPLGLQSAREAIAQHWHEPRLRPAPEHLVVMPSSSEAYHRLFTLLCDPGDEVLAPEPSYPLFSQLAQFANVRLVPYRLHYDGAWHIDFDSIGRARSARTRAILAVSPNNPTGCFTGAAQLKRLGELGLPLISDEVFSRYPLDASPLTPRSAYGSTPALTFCIDGLSKSAGLPHVKLSWLAISGPEKMRDECLRRLAWQCDTYLSVATPIQQALPELLAQSELFRTTLLQRLQHNLLVLREALQGSPISLLRAEGGWYAILQLPAVQTDEQWAQYLLDKSEILVHPGYYYDLDGPPHAVVSLLGPQQQFANAIASLRSTVEAFLAS